MDGLSRTAALVAMAASASAVVGLHRPLWGITAAFAGFCAAAIGAPRIAWRRLAGVLTILGVLVVVTAMPLLVERLA